MTNGGNRVAFLILAALAILIATGMPASAAAPAVCMNSGQNFYQSCIQNAAADGTVTSFEEYLCSQGAAESVVDCTVAMGLANPNLSSCHQSYTIVWEWSSALGRFTYMAKFLSSLSCS